jgi:DNA-binding transcriptional MerR regulator
MGVSRWTLSELAELAARALADAEVRVANGRVTGVPDARLIRWYATIGLLDRPALGSGRVAHYGERHLCQLVAIKRLQAQGLPLAQIQLRLAGATDAQLRSIAALPPDLLDTGVPSEHAGVPSERGGADRTAGTTSTSEPAPFWARRPAKAAEPATRLDTTVDTHPRVYGLRLGELTLLLPAEPAPADLDAIAVAAGPLLDLLADRGLVGPATAQPYP